MNLVGDGGDVGADCASAGADLDSATAEAIRTANSIHTRAQNP
jgi:hypothetical protein